MSNNVTDNTLSRVIDLHILTSEIDCNVPLILCKEIGEHSVDYYRSLQEENTEILSAYMRMVGCEAMQNTD